MLGHAERGYAPGATVRGKGCGFGLLANCARFRLLWGLGRRYGGRVIHVCV